ncbi:MAG: hypothetical protein GF411_02460 [Candidatus Lokiarchaeota archaeon]|nr:hypothetical protein [Candidatus Lokiarchaeota archaeon]
MVTEVHSKRIYKFKPRFGAQVQMTAAEIRSAILNLGSQITGAKYTVEVLSEKDDSIEVYCIAPTGQLVYEMDSKLMFKILNFCEKTNLDFSVGELKAKTPDMEEWE